MFHEGQAKGLDQAVQGIIKLICDSKIIFSKAESRLLNATADNSKMQEDMRMCIAVHQTFVTGLLEWTLFSPRYKVLENPRVNGSIVLQL